MFCSKCGRRAPDEDSFCSHCGSRIERSAAQDANSPAQAAAPGANGGAFSPSRAPETRPADPHAAEPSPQPGPVPQMPWQAGPPAPPAEPSPAMPLSQPRSTSAADNAPAGSMIFAAIAGGGALFAWSKWYPALTVHGLKAIQATQQAGTPIGTGIGASHGFGTSTGTLGLAAVVLLLAGITLTAVVRRRRAIGSAVMLVAALAMIASVIPALIAAYKALNAWANLPYQAGPGPGNVVVSIIASAATHAVDVHSAAPALGVIGAGILALICALTALIGGLTARRRSTRRAAAAIRT